MGLFKQWFGKNTSRPRTFSEDMARRPQLVHWHGRNVRIALNKDHAWAMGSAASEGRWARLRLVNTALEHPMAMTMADNSEARIDFADRDSVAWLIDRLQSLEKQMGETRPCPEGVTVIDDPLKPLIVDCSHPDMAILSSIGPEGNAADVTFSRPGSARPIVLRFFGTGGLCRLVDVMAKLVNALTRLKNRKEDK